MLRQADISEIIVPEDRQRKELVDIEILASSMAQHGQIQPIVLHKNVLIAGERRLAAAKYNGWETILALDKEDLTPTALHIIELEENIKRADLPWRDECAAVTKYYQLRKSQDPNIVLEQVAAELSMSRTVFSVRLDIQEAITSGDELVTKADKLSVASNLVARKKAREREAGLEDIISTIHIGGENEKVTRPEHSGEPETFAPLINADFTEWVLGYSGPRFNFIHCDFPYGVNADKHDQGAAKYFRGYADTPDVYWQLIATLGDNLGRLATDSAHLMFWFSMDYYHETRAALEQMGWRVNPFPLIWHKSDNTGILPDPSRGPRRIYETAFMASRGDRKIVQSVGNVFSAPVVKRVHMSEKSLPMLAHFFRMFVDENTVMLDPTCGSGSACQVAHDAGAKRVLGLEINPDFHSEAMRIWSD